MPEKEFLISHSERLSMMFLFIVGVAVALLKQLRRGKIDSIWKASAYVLLGGFVTGGVGGFLLWIFPTMPFYVNLLITGMLVTILENKDLAAYAKKRLGITDNTKDGDENETKV